MSDAPRGRTAPAADPVPAEWLRQLADALPQIVWMTDASGRTEFFNRRWTEYTGAPYEPSTAGEVARHFIHPDDVPATVAAWEAARREGRTFETEHRIRGASGEYRWFLVRAEPQRDPATGRVTRWFGTSTDVHDARADDEALRRSEARQAFLVRLGDALRPLADPVEIQAVATRTLGEELGAGRVAYGEVAGAGDETFVVRREFRADGLASTVGPHRPSDFGTHVAAALRAGRTFRMDDVVHDPGFDAGARAAYARLGVRAYVVVPLVKAGRIAAYLLANHAEPHTWTDAEVELVEETAERTWDAVERARAEAALRESEARYRSLFTAIDEGYCVVEVLLDGEGRPADYRFVEANPAFEQLTGLHDAVGRTARALVPELESHWVERYGRVALSGEPERFQEGAEAMGGWFDVYASRVGRPEQRLVAILFTNITERKQTEREREQARADAEAANRAKADFLAAMSHELRTPLNAIGGYLELLEMGIHGPLAPAQAGALARVAVNQRHLLVLINDVLAFAKLEAGRVELALRSLAAADLLAGVEPLVAPLEGAREITLAVEPCDGALRAVGDEERVRQVLLNLVGNAVKFTPPGGRVRLSASGDAAWVEVHVEDDGPGIPAEKQERIFEPFVQLDRRFNRPQEGVGLGLAISRDLAVAMGGELRVRSAPGQGSTFTLRLPRADV